jgi:hypothetical protein
VNQRNPYVCLTIVLGLISIAALGTSGLIAAAMTNKPVPESLIAIVSACIGSLSSFLVVIPRGSTGNGHTNPQEQPK